MKITSLIAMLLMLPAFSFAQHTFKPIRDTSAISCARVVYPFDAMPNPQHTYIKELEGFYYIVENMPKPKIATNKIAAVLDNKVGMHTEIKLTGTMYFQCIVNCKGVAGDFQTVHCPENLDNICSMVYTTIKPKLKNWQPGMLHGKNVDVRVQILVKVDSGNFEVVAPLY